VPEFPYRLRSPEAVDALVARVGANPSFVAGCLIIGGSHGYHLELEYLQRADHTASYSVWSDVQGVISTEERTVAIDFADELARVRAGDIANTKRPAGEDAERYTFIAIATPAGGVWVETPTPGTGVARTKGPLDRILELVFPS
jgi:hypothetical protein